MKKERSRRESTKKARGDSWASRKEPLKKGTSRDVCVRSQFRLKFVFSACLLCALSVTSAAPAFDLSMKGPKEKNHDLTMRRVNESSCVKLAFETAIRFYQKVISPVGGEDRCGFRPSCSAYGYQAVSDQGLLIGIMMIGDRLTRCNIWKEAGPDYTLLPNGKLYDPPSKNLLHDGH
jgi:putative membrane protein insertion efficiency factor